MRTRLQRAQDALRTLWRLAAYAALVVVVWGALALLARTGALLAAGSGVAPALGWGTLLAGVWLAHLIMLRWVDREPWSVVRLGRSQLTWRSAGIGLAAGGLGILVPSLLLLGVHWLRAVPESGGSGTWVRYAGEMAVFFLPQSLTEEMLVRGYPFAVLRASLGGGWALALTSAVFGALHWANPGADVQSVLLVMLAGVFLGGVLLLTESLYAAWMAHFAWNWSMAALLHTAVSGLPMRAPDYRIFDNGPDWATGGAWGPEGGAGAAVGMLAALWILIAWRRRQGARRAEPELEGI
ncbi:MAG: CPBP family intramembrane metalloprotease [Gemmatimonadaceae bacterium]|nr:CPBP family intramembrane metalloprotease [Gemmatimonadaceae bacterium]